MCGHVRFSSTAIRLLLVAAGVLVPDGVARSQATLSTWTGVPGNWSNPALWSTSPFYPQNGNPPGSTYTAIVSAPEANTLTVDQPITITSLSWVTGTIAGPGPLTAINGATIRAGTLAGSLIVGTGPTTQITGTLPFVITSTGSLTGPGDVRFTGSGAGIVSINGTYGVTGNSFLGTIPGVNFNAPTTLGSLTIGEALGGTGNINVTGLVNWIGGEIRGSGRIVAQGSLFIAPNGVDYPPPKLSGRTVSLVTATNSMTVTGGDFLLPVGGGGVLSVESGANLDIIGRATFTDSGGGGTILNSGTIRKSGTVNDGSGLGTMSIGSGLTLDNRGLLNLQTGPLAISGTLKGAGTVMGPVAIASGGMLEPGASPGTMHMTAL
jgi:hypothetical protein